MPPRSKKPAPVPVGVRGSLAAEFAVLQAAGPEVEVALALGDVLDDGDARGSEKASAARALLPVLAVIREACVVDEGTWLDDLSERRARRQAG